MAQTNPHLLPMNKDAVILNNYMRNLLLEGLCRRLDLINFFEWHLQIELSKDIVEGKANSICPWCGSAYASNEKTLCVTTKTGRCCCIQCNRDDDFLSILCEKKNMELHQALYYLTGCLEERTYNINSANKGAK